MPLSDSDTSHPLYCEAGSSLVCCNLLRHSSMEVWWITHYNMAEYGRVMPWFLWKRWVTLTAAHPLVSSQLTHHPLNLLPEYPARPPLVATLESKLTNNDFRSFSSRTTHWFYYLNVLASFLDGSKKIIFKYLWRCVQSLDHIKPWNLWLISGTPYTPWWNINHPLTHPPIQFPYSIPCPPSCSIRARTFASPFYARSQRRRKTWLTAALVSNPPPPLFVTATQPLFSYSQSIITIEKSMTNYKKFANFIFLSLQYDGRP